MPSHAEIMSGAPVSGGTRVPIASLTGSLARGSSLDVFLDYFPRVGREQAVSALGIAGDMLVAAASLHARAAR